MYWLSLLYECMFVFVKGDTCFFGKISYTKINFSKEVAKLNLMDIYLWRYQLTRYDVFQRSGISQKTLYSANKKGATSYSGKVLISLGQATADTAREVLDVLLRIEREGVLLRVLTFEELKQAVDEHCPRFLVVVPFLEAIKAYKKSQINEEARLGFDLGTGGTGGGRILTQSVVDYFRQKS